MSVLGDAALVHRRLVAVLSEKAEQGHDTAALERRLAHAVRIDDLLELARAAADLPLRPGWPYREPDALDDIWEQCPATRPTGRLGDVAPDDAAARVRTAFLGRVCGCVLGKPLEIDADLADLRAALEPLGAWPLRDYVPEAVVGRLDLHASWPDTVRERIRFVAPDDDLNYTLLGMLLLEDHGAGFTRADIADRWLQHLPVTMTFGPERTALMKAAVASLDGRRPTDGEARRWAGVLNPGEELCGALIRVDAYGYAFPGRPERAAELAWRDASFTHRRTGVYAAMFVAAAVAIAPVADTPMDVIEAAATFVPGRSRFAEAVRFAVDEVRRADDWLDGYARIHERYGGYGHCRILQEIGTLVNTILFARDVGDGIGLQVSQGNDTDSFGATAGSILGAYFGPGGLDDRWLAPFHDDLRTGLAHFPERSLSAVADRVARLPARVEGGRPAAG